MSGECEKCGEHALECDCEYDAEGVRDALEILRKRRNADPKLEQLYEIEKARHIKMLMSKASNAGKLGPSAKEKARYMKIPKNKVETVDTKVNTYTFVGDFEGAEPGSKVYKNQRFKIIVSPPYGAQGWHMSISHPNRIPGWLDIRDAWYALVPDAANREAHIILPKKSEYVNVCETCMHVHESVRLDDH